MPSPVASPRLSIHDPVGGRSLVPLIAGERITLGRAPTNQVVIHDERASRFHAEVFAADEGWMVRDLESRNGTLLAGKPVKG